MASMPAITLANMPGRVSVCSSRLGHLNSVFYSLYRGRPPWLGVYFRKRFLPFCFLLAGKLLW